MSIVLAAEDNTIAFVKYLQSCYEASTRWIIIWDGASYHRSGKVQEFLEQVNGDRPQDVWTITYVRLAANALEQNPVADIWLLALPVCSQVCSHVSEI